jgi:hypothetical protein
MPGVGQVASIVSGQPAWGKSLAHHQLNLTGRGKRVQISGMKVKTSITLSPELLKAIRAVAKRSGKAAKAYKNRLDFIEAAVWAFIGQMIRDEQNARGIEMINQRADALNEKAADVLAYQVKL